MVRSALLRASRTMSARGHPSRRGQVAAPQDEGRCGIKKAGTRARRFSETGLPRRSARLRPSLPNYFFLYVFFLAFLAFFAAFFAFLAIASSFGLMDGNATPRHARRRASLALSSKPIPTDSLAPAPRCHAPVITLSTVVMHFCALAPHFSRLAPQPSSPMADNTPPSS